MAEAKEASSMHGDYELIVTVKYLPDPSVKTTTYRAVLGGAAAKQFFEERVWLESSRCVQLRQVFEDAWGNIRREMGYE